MKPAGDVGVLGGVIDGGRQRHVFEAHLFPAGSCDVGVFDRLMIEMKGGQLIEAMAVQAALEHVGQHHGVIDRPQGDAVARQHLGVVFDVVPDLEHGLVLEQGLEKRDRPIEGHLFWRVFAVRALRLPAVTEVEGALRRGLAVAQRDVARLAGADRQRHADEIGAHGVERGGFGIDGDGAGGARAGDPLLQRPHLLYRLVGFRLGRPFGGVGAANRAFERHPLGGELAFDARREADEILGAEESHQGFRVGRAQTERVERLGHRHVVLEPHQVPGNARLIGEGHEVLAALGLLDLRRPLQHRLEIAVGVDQLRRRLDPDPRDARHVVGRIPRQRLDIDHLVRPDAELLAHFPGADAAVTHRVHHGDGVRHQLHHILVRRHDGDLGALGLGFPRVGGDQIVGLVPLHLQARHVEGARRLADEFELGHQILGRVGPVGLVVGIDVVAKSPPRGVENDGEVIGLGVLQQLHQHVAEAEHRVGRRAVAPVHRRQCMIGAENVARSVDQEDPRRPPGPLPGLERAHLSSTAHAIVSKHEAAPAIGAGGLAILAEIEVDLGVPEHAAAAVAVDAFAGDGDGLDFGCVFHRHDPFQSSSPSRPLTTMSGG